MQFTPCSGTRPIVLWDSVTSEECMFLKKHKCQVEFLAIEQVLKSFGTCLALPDCNTMPKAESDPTHPTEVVIFVTVRFVVCLYACTTL